MVKKNLFSLFFLFSSFRQNISFSRILLLGEDVNKNAKDKHSHCFPVFLPDTAIGRNSHGGIKRNRPTT